MCGIFGSIGIKREDNLKALSRIDHRGPDDEGTYEYGKLFFGHKRLSIVDTSSAGHQPMISADGNFVLVFNGEIYNHAVIREQLVKKGYQFRSRSDTETLLNGFIEYGSEIVKQLNGIFAFAVLDIRNNQLFIARDQFGVKPLYYYTDGDVFAFGSELKSLLAFPGFSRELDTTALFSYLQLLYAPGEMTPFKKVRKLLPGHFIRYDLASGDFACHHYFQLQYSESLGGISENELIRQTEERLITAVERQLMSDVPVGFFFSGGLDSTLIAAIAKKVLGKSLPCYTIDSGDEIAREGVPDDLAYARRAATSLGVDLHEVKADSNILQFFDKVIWHLDEPQADAAPINVLNICEKAREDGIKVLLGGTAGDDIFTGYRRHRAARMERLVAAIPKMIPGAVDSFLSNFSIDRPIVRRSRKVLGQLRKSRDERFAGYFCWISEQEVLNLFTPGQQQKLNNRLLPGNYLVNRLNTLPRNTNDVNKMLFLEFQGFLPDHNLNYTDKLSMAVGVETRVPYLDLDLVDFASNLPLNMKMRGKTTKYILKKVAEKYLPHEVIYRPKTGFGAPVRRWIREEMSPMIQERLSATRINNRGIFSADAVQDLLKRNAAGEIDASYVIWALLAIESWCEQFVDGVH